MQIGDKVYRGYGNTIKPGVIVARTWVMNPFPERRYIVKDINKAESIVGVLTAAFYGSQEELHRCEGSELILMPAVEYEEEAHAKA